VLAITATGVIISVTIVTSVRHLNEATAAAKRGVESIELGATALGNRDVQIAAAHFQQAETECANALQQLDLLTAGSTRIIVRAPILGPKFTTARSLIEAAQRIAIVGRETAISLPPGREPPSLTIENTGVIRGSFGWLAVVAEDQARLSRVMSDVMASYRLIADIRPQDVPENIRSTFTSFQRIGVGMFGNADRFAEMLKLLVAMTGQPTDQEYLVMLQNNDELRPTGGFAGTYLLIKFRRGTFAITDAPGNGSYALKDLIPPTIRPPMPLDRVTPAMSFIDANWYPDVRQSAQAIERLYAMARGINPTGTIFLTPDLIERLLVLTGPIAIPDTDLTVEAATFLEQTELAAEIDFDRSLREPKQLLISLLPVLLQKVSTLPSDKALAAMAIMFDEVDRGNIVMTASKDPVKSLVRNLGWDGAVVTGSHDYLAIVDGNINSGKTDRSILVDTDLVITTGETSWLHELTIKRTHTAKEGTVLRGYDNITYHRLILPPGTEVLGVEGATLPAETFFITPPSDTTPLAIDGPTVDLTLIDPNTNTTITRTKEDTTVGFWSVVKPSSETLIKVRYSVPRERVVHDNVWAMPWRRQPGSINRTWSVKLQSDPKNMDPVQPSTGWDRKDDGWYWEGDGDHSITVSARIEK